MFLISNGVWILQLLSKKLDFWRNFFLKNFPAEDRTGDRWFMSSLTRPLHQNNLLEIKANSNALWSAGNFCSKFRAAGISNVQIFKSLRSARQFVLQVGNPNSFDMCSGCSKVYMTSFFLVFGDFFFQERQNCLTYYLCTSTLHFGLRSGKSLFKTEFKNGNVKM